MNIVDLSGLPAPEVLEPLDFEAIYAEQLANFRLLMGEGWSAELESDPAVKLLEVGAYRKMGNRARVNDAAKALLLAFAKGPDLDHLGARFNLKRLVVRAADPAAVPPVTEVLEEDDPFRERIQMSWEGLTTAGPRNSYILHARNASGLVADATAESPSPAVAVVTVMSRENDGVADEALLATVAAALNDDDVRPVGDRVTVQSAEIVPYTINAIIHPLGTGSEVEAVLAECRTRLEAWINPRRRLGVEVARSAIDAQLHISGVRRVELPDWVDIVPSKAQAPYCTSAVVNLGR
jgi:phage-related baseplate assembly protein